ncbi:MAG: putative transglutaminase-like cysteine proteinase [Oleiphilaceae bacterium]
MLKLLKLLNKIFISSFKNKKLPLLFIFIFTFSFHAIAFEIDLNIIEQVKERFGDKASARLRYWQKIVNDAKNKTPDEQLEITNSFFNQVRFLSDQEHWEREDYWATPLEMLATNGGDCEDYSIAKYFTLRELGIPDEKLKITYVKAVQLNQAHMILAYYPSPNSEPLILDNLINEILPASQRPDLVPVYSFNGEGLWLSKLSSQEGKRIGNANKLESWKDLMTRHTRLFD